MTLSSQVQRGRVVAPKRPTAVGATTNETSAQVKPRLVLMVVIALCAALVLGLLAKFNPRLAAMPQGISKPLHATLTIGLDLVVLWVGLSSKVSERVAYRVAVAYLIVSAALFAPIINGGRWPEEVLLPGWSPLAVWVLIYCIIVPLRPLTTLIVAATATAIEPIIALSMDAAGMVELPPSSELVYRFGPNVAAPLLAFVVAKSMWRMRNKVVEARQLGGYRLIDKLGEGGMGEVWRAEHRLLKRPAAIKLIRPVRLGPDTAHARRRFEHEARATASLRSSHTIDLYDFGITDDGHFYYVMELLDGLDFASLVQRFGPQPADRVAAMLRHACHSLHEAHANGLVHRDIKPANLFLCRHGMELDYVKVLDFGLVKRRFADATETQLSVDGTITGTPAYMAPEQILGQAVDGRADLYNLGCVAFYLLTGREVFTGDTPMAVMVAHAQTPPEPPSAVTELPIPEAMDALVLRCLAKNPAERPANAAELANALNHEQLAGDWTSARAKRWWDTQHPPAPPATAVAPTEPAPPACILFR